MSQSDPNTVIDEDSLVEINKDPLKPRLETENDQSPPTAKDPTRYGDWEKGGRCIDF
jgi:hypothetical protein